MTTTIVGDKSQGPPEVPGKAPPRGDETRKLLQRAEKGDRTCLPEIQALLSDPERGARLVELFGSPAEWLRESLMDRAAGKHLAVREAMERKLTALRTELEGSDPTPLERLLAERAVYCWLMVYGYENEFSRCHDLTISQAEFHQKKIDKAHRRFLSSVRTLAQVRKLALPTAVQINAVGTNQINVT